MKYLLLPLFLFSAMVIAGDCINYGSTVITGRLVSKTFPGPPNYESIEAGDEEETYYFLALPSPICVVEGQDANGLEPSQTGVKLVQLILNGKSTYNSLRQLLGGSVSCQGNLFAAITAHHHSDVLLSEVSCW